MERGLRIYFSHFLYTFGFFALFNYLIKPVKAQR
jgi:hypothetical protein